MWASSQLRENEQCLLHGAQNSLSQWNALASQAEGNFHFFFEPWWELSWHSERGGEEVRCGAWGWLTLQAWLCFGWPLSRCCICPFLFRELPSWLACMLVGGHNYVGAVQGCLWDLKKRDWGWVAIKTWAAVRTSAEESQKSRFPCHTTDWLLRFRGCDFWALGSLFHL